MPDELRKTVIIKLVLKAERGIALVILFLFLDRVSSWPQTLHVAENGPDFPILSGFHLTGAGIIGSCHCAYLKMFTFNRWRYLNGISTAAGNLRLQLGKGVKCDVWGCQLTLEDSFLVGNTYFCSFWE